jgi:hypothetical protein
MLVAVSGVVMPRMRIACLVAIAALIGAPVLGDPAGETPARAATVAPMAIDIRELFGDENEADENEDEAEEESGRPAEDGSQPGPLGSLSAVIPIVALGLLALWYVRRLLRRLRARFGQASRDR